MYSKYEAHCRGPRCVAAVGLVRCQIREHHPDLTEADLTVAWSYYRAHAEEIDRAIKEDEET